MVSGLIAGSIQNLLSVGLPMKLLFVFSSATAGGLELGFNAHSDSCVFVLRCEFLFT